MNYLDLLRSQSSLAQQSGQQTTPGAGGPLPAFMTVGQAPIEQQLSTQPMMAPAPVAPPPMGPQPIYQAPAPVEGNPFDRFDSPATTAPVASPLPVQSSPAPVAAPVPQAPAPAPQIAPEALHNGWSKTVNADPAFIKATRKFQADMVALVNGGASREQIMARYEQERLRDPNLTISGIDEALAYRVKNPNVAIPMGLVMKEGDAPAPMDVHGEDLGQLHALGLATGSGIFMNGLDEVGGASGATGNAIAGFFGGGTGESWTDTYTRLRDENRQALADAQYYHPGTFLAGEVAGNLLTAPLTSVRGAAGLGRVVAEGAGLGFVNGFNSGTDGVIDRLETGAKGAAVGALFSGTIGGAANGIARRVARNRAGRDNAIIAAADRLNRAGTPNEITGQAAIRPLVGQVSNGGVGSQAQAFLQPTFVGGGLGGLWRSQGRFENAVEGAANRIANDVAGGNAARLTDTAAITSNRNVPGSLGAYAFETQAAAKSVYGAAEQAAGNVRIPTPSAVAKLDEIIQRFGRETPGDVPGLSALQDLRTSLVRGENPNATSAGWSVEGLRRLRTSFGDNLDSNARTAKQVANEIWGPLSDDIFRGLRVSGRPDAAAMYRTADRMWARRSAGMDVIQRVIGKEGDNLSADAVASRMSNMSRRDYVHFARALNEIDPAQASMIRGSLISELGRPTASRATNEAGFSLESFATRWTDMSNHAKRAMYSPQTVADLNDLATLARANRVVGQLGNPSRSGIMMMNYNQAKTGAGMLGNALSGSALLAGQWSALVGAVGLSRMLGSPGVARALVRGARSGKVEVAARSLTALAARTPTAAQDILQLRDTILGNVPANTVTIVSPGQPVEGAPPHSQEEGVAPIDPAMTPEANPFDQFGDG